jgi:hypothetical protein
MATNTDEELIAAALAFADDATVSPADRADLLVEIAMGLHRRPENAERLRAAVDLYHRAIALCAPDDCVIDDLIEYAMLQSNAENAWIVSTALAHIDRELEATYTYASSIG